jgi:hypothetical protein
MICSNLISRSGIIKPGLGLGGSYLPEREIYLAPGTQSGHNFPNGKCGDVQP